MSKTRPMALALACALVPLLAGCGSNGTTPHQNRIRTLNAYVPASGADGSVTVTAGGATITGSTAVPFGQFANGGGYYFVSSGTFAPVATSPGLAAPLQFATPPTLPDDGTPFTLIAAGQAGQTGTTVPQLVLVPSYTPSVLAIPSGDAAIRVVNVSLNPNPVGLYATSGGVPSSPLTTELASVPFGYSSATNPYVAIPISQLVSMALVDSTNATSALSLSTTSNLNSTAFTAGQAYTLYVYGQPANGAQPLGATWVLDYPVR